MSDLLTAPPSGLPGRLKSGLLFAFVGFAANAVLGFLLNLCTAPLAALLGAAAGWLAARWEAAPTAANARQGGLTAGLLTGLGSALGSSTGGLLGALWAGASVVQTLGQQAGAPFSESTFWTTAVATVGCLGLSGGGLAALLGSLGGLAWFEGQHPAAAAGAPPAMGGQRGALLWIGGLLALTACCAAGFAVLSGLTVVGLFEGGGLFGP
ncbi:MAG: hypothetical protein GX605_13540 [Chloroflexi bacterium]|nr:hypothetical protein [Chloroflexota bacterium]